MRLGEALDDVERRIPAEGIYGPDEENGAVVGDAFAVEAREVDGVIDQRALVCGQPPARTDSGPDVDVVADLRREDGMLALEFRMHGMNDRRARKGIKRPSGGPEFLGGNQVIVLARHLLKLIEF